MDIKWSVVVITSLLLLNSLDISNSYKHHLVITNDNRKSGEIETFALTEGGVINMTILNFQVILNTGILFFLKLKFACF